MYRGMRRTNRKPLVYGEQGLGPLVLTRVRSLFTFTASNSGSFGTWTTNGGATISGTTFNVLTGGTSQARSINHNQSIPSTWWNGLKVTFDSSASGFDGFGIGINDFGGSNVNTIPVDTGGGVNTHCVWLEFGGGSLRIYQNNGSVLTSVSTTTSGSNSWEISYSGSSRTSIACTVKKNGSTVLTSSATLILPETGRLCVLGRSGGNAGNASFSNIIYSAPV